MSTRSRKPKVSATPGAVIHPLESWTVDAKAFGFPVEPELISTRQSASVPVKPTPASLENPGPSNQLLSTATVLTPGTRLRRPQIGPRASDDVTKILDAASRIAGRFTSQQPAKLDRSIHSNNGHESAVSMQKTAAVANDRLPGDHFCIVAGQERDERGHVLGCDTSLDRLGRDHAVVGVLV